ncbi:hypothetical protein PMPD1_1589 [Paramixta manurensis]|uniref:Uncharacterized protein n=1 Tax=Paramixta manurensis TaxID=2740817 RepID=A0A6M8UI91_9GAMM|nr:hypothetical protein PMPD1_1589 [Erwiniaceae bacterium PD-1]
MNMMNETGLLRQLHEQGFTAKDIAILRQYVEQDGVTYLSLLKELRKRLIVMSIFTLCMFVLWACMAIFEYHQLFSFSITMLFFLVIVYIMTPVRLATKAYLFLKKEF